MTTLSRIYRFSVLLAISLLSFTASAQFETNFGLIPGNENYWEGIPVWNRQAVTLINTNRDNSRSMLVSRHSLLNGNVLASANISLTNRSLEGRSLGVGRGLLGFRRRSFITGGILPAGAQQGAFMLRTRFNGSPLCFYLRPGFPNARRIEEGRVVENRRLRAVFAGNSRPVEVSTSQRDTACFWVTKLRPFCDSIRWSYCYPSTDPTWNDFTIREGCLGPYQSPGGKSGRGLALTGYYGRFGQEGHHAFVSMIDYDDGHEVWRTACPSDWQFDEGLDIVYDPAGRRYFVVGYAAENANSPHQMYTAVVRSDGAFVGSAVHDLAPEPGFRSIEARDVCLSLTRGRAVVTGYVEHLEQNAFVARTFATDLTIQPNATANWARYYLESFPQSWAFSAEEIRIDRSLPNRPGYLITTGGQLNNPDITLDAQVLRIAPDGSLGRLACKTNQFRLTPRVQQAQGPELRYTQMRFPWVRVHNPDHQHIRLRYDSCEN